MMAIANYKAVAVFEHNGRTVKLGEEIILPDRVGEKLVEDGKLVVGRYLDPADPNDQKKIDAANEEYQKEYEANKKKEDDRDAKKDAELKAADEAKKAVSEQDAGPEDEATKIGNAK